ncbi:glycosyltransferase family 2 protein [Adlercreutzia sp. ZJ138]|uniref:glycosyltransferase family 2 protein n=1 Tax=Adlercreutzia sp. ZJ138 TaxID=2709405 RepID=UPI0013ED4F89|nr:glycosyltransferase family 2 protein [Adlercreutzia sp. ZJ138]
MNFGRVSDLNFTFDAAFFGSEEAETTTRAHNDLPLISVVVPVFNTEKYLKKCLESVRAQTYEHLQIILVDDGSSDASGDICDSYQRLDGRFVVIHQENRGLSAARNAGTAIADGTYVAYVDSDDYVAPGFISVLYDAIMTTRADIAAIPAPVVFSDGEEISLWDDFGAAATTPRVQRVPSVAYQERLLYQRYANGAQFRLYLTDIMKEHLFPEGLLYEDMATIYRVIRAVDSVAVVNAPSLYAYRSNPIGITQMKYTRKKMNSILHVTRTMKEDIVDWYPELEKACASRCFASLRAVYAQVPAECVYDSESLWLELQSYSDYVIRDKSARRRERIAAVISNAGRACFDMFCRCCRLLGLMR